MESSCLKCHHNVTELQPSEKFPEPPAPKLLKGYNLIRKYGCYGCHEVNGFEGPNKRVGPDMRLEPNFFAAALAIKADTGFEKLSSEEQGLIGHLIDHPEEDGVRHRISAFLVTDEVRETDRKEAERIMRLYDKDGDNFLSKQEVRQTNWDDDLFQEDRNRDEKISLKELYSYYASRRNDTQVQPVFDPSFRGKMASLMKAAVSYTHLTLPTNREV